MDPIRRQRRDMCVIGFALFSMFFGAGNVIFPPYLGLGCGREWALGFLCYYLADIGLALMAIFAIVRSGSSQAITRPRGLHRKADSRAGSTACRWRRVRKPSASSRSSVASSGATSLPSP